MPWWLGNQIALSVFVLVTIAIALAIGSRHRGEALFWRRIETAVTLLGVVSLIMLSSNVDRDFASRYLEGYKKGALWTLKLHVEFAPKYLCKTKFEKSAFSPSNFDDIVADQSIACQWARKIQERITGLSFESS